MVPTKTTLDRLVFSSPEHTEHRDPATRTPDGPRKFAVIARRGSQPEKGFFLYCFRGIFVLYILTTQTVTD